MNDLEERNKDLTCDLKRMLFPNPLLANVGEALEALIFSDATLVTNTKSDPAQGMASCALHNACGIESLTDLGQLKLIAASRRGP